MKVIKIISLMFFSLLVSLALLIMLEILIGLCFDRSQDRLSDVLRIIQQDSVLFWKQKPNLNTEFQNQNIKTNRFGFRAHEIKTKNKKRLICLGASPTFGWGVKYEDTYPVLIGKELNKKNIDIESINAGEVAYSSLQGLNLFKNVILDLKPDIITVSYVINDIDKYRFFRSNSKRDSQLDPLSKQYIFVSNLVYQSSTFDLMRRLTLRYQSNKTKYYGQFHNNKYNENRRVSLDEYENNLHSIIDIAQENNIKVILVVMPVNLPMKKKLTEQENLEIQSLLFSAKDEIENNNYMQAKEKLNKILSIDKYSAKANYYLGIIADKEKQYKLVDEFFEKAKNFEIFDCALISLEYNAVMRKVAKDRKIPLCDSAKDFKEHNQDYLFVDPKLDCFHPNAKGHKIIADRLADILNNYYLGGENGK